MGDLSDLRFIPASSAATPIDWTRVPEATKKYLIKQYGYDWDKSVSRPLPATIGDLAKWFNESKFFGYFRSDVVKTLMDISEFGLQPTPLPASSHSRDHPVGPRFYMTYLEQVWFLLFMPGTREGITGYSEDIIKNTNGDVVYNEAYYKEFAAKATAMAQVFDVTLEQEVSRGKAEMVASTKKLGGWSVDTLQSSLESAQCGEAILKLPTSHPAYQALMASLFRSSCSR